MLKLPKNMEEATQLAMELSGKVLDKLSVVCKNLSEKAAASAKPTAPIATEEKPVTPTASAAKPSEPPSTT